MVAEPMDSRAAGFMIGTRSSMEITADTLRRERAGIVWPVEMVSREEIASREETALRVVTPHQTRVVMQPRLMRAAVPQRGDTPHHLPVDTAIRVTVPVLTAVTEAVVILHADIPAAARMDIPVEAPTVVVEAMAEATGAN